MAATPTIATGREQLAHAIDYVAERFALYRYDDESLADFRKRVLDVYTHPSNASNLGLIFGGARQLGSVTRTIGIIKPRQNLDGSEIAAAPGINITNSVMEFWEDFTLGALEKKFDIFSDFPRPDMDVAFYVKEIYDWIKSSSLYWEWEQEPVTSDLWLPAKNLVPVRSYTSFKNPVRVFRGLTYLPDDSIVPGSIKSTSPLVETEVASLTLVTAEGEYYVDYINSILYTYDDGTGRTVTISYSHYDDRIFLEWSPVDVQELTDEEFFSGAQEYEKAADNSTYEQIRYSQLIAQLIIEAYRKDGTFWFAEDSNDTPIDILGEYQISDVITDSVDRYYLDLETNIRDLLREDPALVIP